MKPHLRAGCALFLGVTLGYNPSIYAGSTGAMNGLGIGFAGVNVASPTTARTPLNTLAGILEPGAAMSGVPPSDFNYTVSGPLPAGASGTTTARLKGMAGYKWFKTLSAVAGDTVDNDAIQIEKGVVIDPVECAFLHMESSSQITGNSGLITVEGTATGGTAMLLRGYEITDGFQPQSAADLQAHGELRWEVLVKGPFNFDKDNCTALIIPFTFKTTTANVYFTSDGVALSKKFAINCPADVDFGCGPVAYSATTEGGCEPVAVTYDPPADQLPIGTTIVKVTATDSANNTVKCQFTAKRGDSSFALQCPTSVSFACFATGPLDYGVQVIGGCPPVNVSYSVLPNALPANVTTMVKVTATDAAGAKKECTFPATRHELGFSGFLSPIDGIDGSCNAPVRTLKRGANIALKFGTSCDGQTTVEGAVPTLDILTCSGQVVINDAPCKSVANQWHFNWDTSQLPAVPGGQTYQLEVSLQNGVKKKVFVKIK